MNRMELVVELLRTADGPMTTHQIADAIECHANQAKHAVKVLVKRNRIHIHKRTPSACGRNTCWYLHGAGESAPEIPKYSKHSKAVSTTPTVDRLINRQRRKAEAVGIWGGLL